MSDPAAPLDPDKLAYSVNEACAATSLGLTKLYALITEGKIRAKRDRGRTVILRGELLRYLDSLPDWKPQERVTPRRKKAA